MVTLKKLKHFGGPRKKNEVKIVSGLFYRSKNGKTSEKGGYFPYSRVFLPTRSQSGLGWLGVFLGLFPQKQNR